jgi:hypothetical protein
MNRLSFLFEEVAALLNEYKSKENIMILACVDSSLGLNACRQIQDKEKRKKKKDRDRFTTAYIPCMYSVIEKEKRKEKCAKGPLRIKRPP